MVKPWLGIALTSLILIVLVVGLRNLQRRWRPHPEVIRKLLHIGMGLTTLSFPFLFRAIWPVLVLLVIALGGMLALRRHQGLKTDFGCIISGVKRTESWGEIYFPLGIASLFIIAKEQPLLYAISILLLTLADAAAALVGTHYGRLKYATPDGQKSIEGSLAFALTALYSVYLPLHFIAAFPPAQALLIALLVSFWLTLIEALAWRGLDNLFIPLATFILLQILVGLSLFSLTIGLLGSFLLGQLALLRRDQTSDWRAQAGESIER